MPIDTYKSLRRIARAGIRKGQALVVVIAAIPAILGAMTLVIDIGNAYYNTLEIQTASDSAVLAGGLYLPSYPDQAISFARQYANTNGLSNSEITSISVTPDDKTVTISASRSLPCFLCAILGESEVHAQVTSGGSSGTGSGLRASATSGIVPIRAAAGIVPIGVDYRTSLNYGQQVVLKQGQVGPGNWGPLALGGSGGDLYRTNVENGYSGVVTAGDMLNTETGNVVGPTSQAFNYRLSAGKTNYPSGTFQTHDLNDPRVMLIPLVDFSGINGSAEVPLKGFAMMWTVSEDQQGNITCYFIQQSIPQGVPDPTAMSAGATTPILLQ
jgi:Putative Flp pilus-assembly TadE/G-like